MLEASGVGYAYGRSRRRSRRVFTDLSWAVQPGVTTLLLGPNGAGKSTLLKLLAGQVRPEEGVISWAGRADRMTLFSEVGWMPQEARASKGLSVLEQVELAAWVGGKRRDEAARLARETLELVQLSNRAGARSTSLSGGQLRRLALAQACVRGGQVLLLDEPTAGLDPAQTINFRAALRALDYPGGRVISTHQVADIAEDVDRVVVLSEGAIVFDGTVAGFRDRGRHLGVTSGNLAETFAAMMTGGDA